MSLGASTPLEKPLCACVELESTVEAVEQVSSVDWRQLDEDALARAWPEAKPLPCESGPLSGIAAATAAIQRCCDTCGTCGGPFFHQDGDSSERGLRSILTQVCRQSSDQALSDLKRIVDVAVPRQTDAAYEEGWSLREETKSIHNAYRWHSNDGTFILEIYLGPIGDRWAGSFELIRCNSVSVLKEWILDDGTTLNVTEADVVESAGGERELRFSYVSQCLLRDYECLQSEWRSLWPRLHSMAEVNETTTVFLSGEDCKGGSITVYPKRETRGDWDLPW